MGLIMTRSFLFQLLLGAAICSSAFGTAAAKSAALEKAQAQITQQDYKSAIKTLSKAREAGEDNFATNHLLVEAYFERIEQVGMLKKMGLAKNMRKAMERAHTLDPLHKEALQNLMQFHLEAPSAVGADKDIARALAKKALIIDPVFGHRAEASLARSEKDYAAAITALDAAAKIAPQNTDLMLERGFAHVAMEDPSAAILSFEACFETDPARLDCLYQLGKTAQVAQLASEKGKAAFVKYLAAADAVPAFIPHAHLRLGHLHAQSGDIEAAQAAYEKAVEIGDLNAAKKALRKLP